MKKIIIASVMAMAALAAGAKTADELRIYINPGHGSWTPNDRPCTLVGHGAYSRTNTDTLSFFESNTNLIKGFAVMDRLISYGLKFDRTLNQTGEDWQIGAARDLSNNIVMSRVKNGPYHDDNGTANQLGDNTPADLTYYNRNLSEICAEVEANNFDMFISIHSNAATEGSTSNYPLFIYRGYDSPIEETGVTLEHQTLSRDMCAKGWPYAFSNEHMEWSHYSLTSSNIRGDIDFYHGSATSSLGYKGYLGVLRHGTPGFLVEGYFHTYQPARHRAMNWDADYVEGTAYAHGIADYYGLTKEKSGLIYGIARDKDTKFKDAAYTPKPGSDDMYLPLNGLKVTLKKNGATVGEYTTDNYYNGAFVFEVAPGTYTIEFSGEGYTKYVEPVEVEVKAAQVAYPKVFIRNDEWQEPPLDTQVYPDYVGNETKSILPAEEYVYAREYVDEAIPQLAGKIIRRSIVREGKLYILALDKSFELAAKLEGDAKPVPTIIVYDTAAKTVLAEVSTEGMHGSLVDAGDIQLTADGVLLASNYTKVQKDDTSVQAEDEGRGTYTIYKWANDEKGVPTGAPTPWLSTQTAAGFARAYVGRFAWSGSSTDGKAMVPVATISNLHRFRTAIIYAAAGAQTEVKEFAQPNHGETEFDKDYTVYTSPFNTDNFIVVGSNGTMREYKSEDGKQAEDANNVLNNYKNAQGLQAFRYAGAIYMALPGNNGTLNEGVSLIDVTRGLSTGAVVSTRNTNAEGLEGAALANGEVEVVRDANESITAAYLNLYLVRDGKVSKFTTRNAEQPKHRVEYAYALTGALSEDEKNYNISFKLTGDVTDAKVILSPVGDEYGSDVEVNLGALASGAHTVSVPRTDLIEGQAYSWAVRTVSASIPVSGEYSADPNGLTVRGGVITITDPEYDSFGYTTVCHGKNNGLDVYDPAGNKVGTRLFAGHATMGGTTNQSNPFRGHEREGKVLLATWGDDAEGIVVFDPANLTTEPYSLFAGTKQASGNHVYEGANLGGGTSGICVVGKGDDTRIYSHSEDHGAETGAANAIVRYDIGSAWQITKAPVLVGTDGFKGLLANGQGEMSAYGNGFFISQARNSGNNAKGVPCFVYVDAATEAVTFNSGVLNDAETYGIALDGNNTSLAITPDGKTLAVGNCDGKRIFVYDVTWNGTTPSLKFRYTIPGGAAWAHMRFDYAGNLHAFNRDGNGYHTYVLAQVKPAVTVPARSTMTVTGAADAGVNDIVADSDANAPEVYYNLNGVRMPDGATLAPGVYIVRQGAKSRKVLVK